MSEPRDTINALGRELLATLEPGHRSVTLHSDGSISVTATNGLVSHTSNAIGLYDAMHMARRNVEIKTDKLVAESQTAEK